MNNKLNSKIITKSVKEFTDLKIDKKIKLELTLFKEVQMMCHLGIMKTKKIISNLHL